MLVVVVVARPEALAHSRQPLMVALMVVGSFTLLVLYHVFTLLLGGGYAGGQAYGGAPAYGGGYATQGLSYLFVWFLRANILAGGGFGGYSGAQQGYQGGGYGGYQQQPGSGGYGY